jgi:hypothetical protein
MRRVLAFAALLVCPIAAQAQVKIEQAPEYKAGQVIRTVAEQKTKQTLTIAGMNVDTKAEVFTAVRETVGEQTANGTPINGEFEYFILNLTTPVGEVAFDSQNPDAGNAPGELAQFVDLFKASSKAKWTTLMTDSKTVKSVTYEGEPFKDLPDALQKETNPERYKKEYETQLARFPDGPVSPGDTWKRTEEPDIGGGQSFKMEKEFTYIGTEEVGGKTFDKIGVKCLSCRYHMTGEGGAPIKVEDAELKVLETEGTMLYDREQKTITSTTEKVRLQGDLKMTLDINGQKQELPGAVDLTIESKSTVEPPQ